MAHVAERNLTPTGFFALLLDDELERLVAEGGIDPARTLAQFDARHGQLLGRPALTLCRN